MSEVVVVSPAERDHAYATLLLAFADDPVVRWVLADSHAYATVWPAFCVAYAGAAFEHGTATALEGFAAVSMWLPPGVSSDGETMERLMMAAAPESVRRDLGPFFEQMDATHPTFEHWYLPLIGVDPIAQGRGLGTTLLRDALERCDRDGLPAFLEATSPRSRDLYLRHGFEVAREIQHGDSAPMWAMLRQPAGG